jgi:pantoate--beta-alanine ligase
MKNGLAYSSRNKLLNQKSIEGSALLVSKLKNLFIQLKKDLNNKFLINDFINKNKVFNIEYLELRNKNNLSKKISKKNVKIFIAFYVKGVRLIDNF